MQTMEYRSDLSTPESNLANETFLECSECFVALLVFWEQKIWTSFVATRAVSSGAVLVSLL